MARPQRLGVQPVFPTLADFVERSSALIGSPAQVIEKVLQEGGVDFSPKSVGEKREYWVQYSESDFDFVSRLWEEEGLYYRFDHASPNCTLKVGNGWTLSRSPYAVFADARFFAPAGDLAGPD